MKFIGGKPLWKKVNSPPPETFVPGKKSRKRRNAAVNTRQFNKPMDKQTWSFLSDPERRRLNIDRMRDEESEYVEGIFGRNKNLCANNSFCEDTLGYSRELMPQLKPAIEFLSVLSKFYKINSNIVLRKRSALVPSQGEICKPKVNRKVEALEHDLSTHPESTNINKATGLEANPFSYNVDPETIIISSDGPEQGKHYIVDGHHKWAATKIIDLENDTDTDLTVALIQAPLDLILDISKTLQYPSTGMNHPNPYKGCYMPEELEKFNPVWTEDTYGSSKSNVAEKEEQKELQQNIVAKWIKKSKTRKARYLTNPTAANSATLKQKEQIMATRRFAKL